MSDTASPQPEDTGPDALDGGDVASMEDILASIRSMIAEEATEPVITQYEITPNIGTEVARARSAVRDRIREGKGHLHRNDPIPVIPPGATIGDTLESAQARAEAQAKLASAPSLPESVPGIESLLDTTVEEFDIAKELGMEELVSDAPDPVKPAPLPPIVAPVQAAEPLPDAGLDVSENLLAGDTLAGLDLTQDVEMPSVVEAVDMDIPTLDDISTLDHGADIAEPMGAEPMGAEPIGLDSLLPEPAPESVTVETAMAEMAAPSEAVEALADDTVQAAPAIDFSQTEDMDLVKSLMAELTEDPSAAGDAQADEADDGLLELDEDWLEADLAIPDIEPEDEVRAATPEPMEQIFDEIVDQAIADEEHLDAADAAAVPAATATAAAPVAAAAAGATVVSLADIARRAEADAAALGEYERATDTALTLEDIGRPEPVLDEPASDSVEIFEAAADVVEDDTPESLLPEVTPEVSDVAETVDPAPPVTPTETPDTASTEPDSSEVREALETEVMARNAPLEEIIADDVEVEAGTAFAELNRLVEEKNVFEERGPRIGDLVQEALKPMLKEWLDENLKGIVERAVTKEVKRISSGK